MDQWREITMRNCKIKETKDKVNMQLIDCLKILKNIMNKFIIIVRIMVKKINNKLILHQFKSR